MIYTEQNRNTSPSAGTKSPSRAERVAIRDLRAMCILSSRWAFGSADERAQAAKVALAGIPATRGLIRSSVFEGLDDFSLFQLSQWFDPVSRDRYASDATAGSRAAPNAQLREVDRRWRERAAPYRSFVSPTEQPAQCLVVARQTLKRADEAVARDWVDTVIRALQSGTAPMEGLVAATFMINVAGDVVLNLAEWTNADAHRIAQQPVEFGAPASIGESPEWRATREHPGIEAQHELHRYALVRSVDPYGVS